MSWYVFTSHKHLIQSHFVNVLWQVLEYHSHFEVFFFILSTVLPWQVVGLIKINSINSIITDSLIKLKRHTKQVLRLRNEHILDLQYFHAGVQIYQMSGEVGIKHIHEQNGIKFLADVAKVRPAECLFAIWWIAINDEFDVIFIDILEVFLVQKDRGVNVEGLHLFNGYAYVLHVLSIIKLALFRCFINFLIIWLECDVVDVHGVWDDVLFET